MIEVNLNNITGITQISQLTQWDFGRSLKITGLDIQEDTEVHFANHGEDKAIIMMGKYENDILTVDIPDISLTKGTDVFVFVYESSATTGRTIRKARIPVEKRAKPTDYVAPEAKDYLMYLLEESERTIMESQKIVSEATIDRQKLEAALIHSTHTGELIQTTDSANVKPKNIRLFGESTQKQYPGNQLLPYPFVETTKTEGGITFTDNGDGTVTLNGTCTEEAYVDFVLYGSYGASNNVLGSDIAISGCYAGGADSQYMINTVLFKDGTKVSENKDLGSGVVISGVDYDGVYIYIRVYSGVTFSNAVFEPMVNTGTEILPWEPFVGNAPSPSINYPQPIEYAGANGSIECKLLTGNVFDASFRNFSGTIWKSGCSSITEENDVFTLVASASDMYVWNVLSVGSAWKDTNVSCKLMEIPDGIKMISVNLSDSTFCKNYVTWFDENKISIGYENKNESEFTVKPIDGAKYFTIRFGKNDAVVGNTYTTTVMINYGQPKEYEPYTEQPFTVLTPNGLKSNGDVRDYVDFESSKRVEAVKRFKLSTDLTWNYKTSTNQGNHLFQANISTHGVASTTWAHVIGVNSTHFVCTGKTNDDELEYPTVFIWSNEITFAFPPTSEMSTLDLFKEFITNNDVYVEYVLAEPIETDLTDEEMAQYNALVMNYPNTFIYNSDNALMGVEYIADTQKHIEQNYIPKDSWNYFDTYIPSGDDTGFNYNNLIKCREVRFVGKLKFAAVTNVGFNFRTENHQTSAYHRGMVVANLVQDTTQYYQIEAYFRRITDYQVVIEVKMHIDNAAQVVTAPPRYYRYMIEGSELAENIVQFGISTGAGVVITNGYIDVYTRGVVE